MTTVTSYVNMNIYLEEVAMENNMENKNDFQRLTTANLMYA
jgi:hypothetical protein